MRDNGLAIFLYDLIILGNTRLCIDDYFMNHFYDFSLMNLDKYKRAISAIAHSSLNPNDYRLNFYADDIVSALEKVPLIIKFSKGWREIFDSIDPQIIDEIGQMAVEFNEYLSFQERLTYIGTNSIYRFLKQ